MQYTTQISDTDFIPLSTIKTPHNIFLWLKHNTHPYLHYAKGNDKDGYEQAIRIGDWEYVDD